MNAAQVFVPVGVTREGLRADGALVRPEAGVDVEVLLQDRGLHEALVAHRALVRAQVGVSLGVLHEAAAEREHLAANLTHVQHGLEVRGDVLEDEVLLAVGARADGAGVALLAVHVQVALARPQRRELQPALPAPVAAARAVRALVQQHVPQGLERELAAVLRAAHGAGVVHHARVLAQAPRGLEPVPAFPAQERLLPGALRVVGLRVSYQQRQPREGLTAISTLKSIFGHVIIAMVPKQMILVVLFPTDVAGVYQWLVSVFCCEMCVKLYSVLE